MNDVTVDKPKNTIAYISHTCWSLTSSVPRISVSAFLNCSKFNPPQEPIPDFCQW